MKALVYHGPGKRAWEEVPDAVIREPTDAVVRVDAVTICGTDLHILGGDVPEVAAGRILVVALAEGVDRAAVGGAIGLAQRLPVLGGLEHAAALFLVQRMAAGNAKRIAGTLPARGGRVLSAAKL